MWLLSSPLVLESLIDSLSEDLDQFALHFCRVCEANGLSEIAFVGLFFFFDDFSFSFLFIFSFF